MRERRNNGGKKRRMNQRRKKGWEGRPPGAGREGEREGYAYLGSSFEDTLYQGREVIAVRLTLTME